MIIQKIEPTRIFSVFFMQLIVTGIFLVIAFLILKRRRTKLSLTASFFYLTLAACFIINPFYLIIFSNPTVYILYFITVYLMFFSPIFLLTFLMALNKSKFESNVKIQLLIYLIYGVLLFCILYFVPKITIDESTNWRALWSAPLFVVMVILMNIIIIQCYIYQIKILVSFKDKSLKRKWILFFIGFTILTFDINGLLIYCVWDNIMYRTIWSYISTTVIIAAILMYFTFKQNTK